MSLTGSYATDAAKTYKTIEGRQLLASVREVLAAVDVEMCKPSTVERGKRLAVIMNLLEMAADSYDLFGEKDRRKKKP